MYVEFESVPANTTVACDDCTWGGTADQIEKTGADDERWGFGEAPNGVVGECPACGALAYVKPLEKFIVVGVDCSEQQFFLDYVAARDEEHAKEQVLDAREYANDCVAYSLEEWRDAAAECERTSIEELQEYFRVLQGEDE